MIDVEDHQSVKLKMLSENAHFGGFLDFFREICFAHSDTRQLRFFGVAGRKASCLIESIRSSLVKVVCFWSVDVTRKTWKSLQNQVQCTL